MPYDREGNYTIEVITLTDDTTITHAPTTQTLQLKPDVGFVYEVLDIGYQAPDPVGSGAGTHQLYISYNGAFNDMARIKATTGNAVWIAITGFDGDSSEVPSAIGDQYDIMHNRLHASNSVPIDFAYTNSTDVDQSGTRTLIIVVKKYREAIL